MIIKFNNARRAILLAIIATFLLTASLPAGADEPKGTQEKPMAAPKSAWDGGPRPIHEPIECLARFNITQYPIIAWCFHGQGQPYDESYVQAAKDAGFNVLLDSQEMLKPAEKVGGMKVMGVAFRFDTKRIEAQTLKRFGADHPALLGFVLDDNCKKISGNSKNVATWLKENHPHLVPYVSENQDLRGQMKSDIRILGTQNWRMKGGGAAQADGYCGRMEMDRHAANMYQMAFWPLWYDTKSNAGSIRFQTYAAIAYGAQGVVCFAYTPSLPPWAPDGPARKAHAPAAQYVHEVIGRHVLGTRSSGVLHSSGMGPKAQRTNRWVARLDSDLVAGMLYVEKQLAEEKNGRPPDYVMLVHKRFTPGDEPPPRKVRLDFTPAIFAVEVLEPKAKAAEKPPRRIEPGFHAAVDLLCGDGRLLVVNPELKDVLGPTAGPYRELCERASRLSAESRAKATVSTEAGVAATAPAAPPKQDASWGALAAEAVKLRDAAKDAQARDVLVRLVEALESQRAPDKTEQPAPTG